VPVEKDGSVFFEAPTGVPIYFQALDKNGRAIQSMKSDTYLHPGETLVCVGCHEPKRGTPKMRSPGIAMKKAARKLTPAMAGANPLSFPRLIQPILDAKCLACHKKNATTKKAPSLSGKQGKKYGWSKSYETLQKFGWGKAGGNGVIFRNGKSYSIPGKIGANAARLPGILEKHIQKKRLTLTDAQWRAFYTWLDCNSVFYSAYRNEADQRKGKRVSPILE
jgi:hypothetical protein